MRKSRRNASVKELESVESLFDETILKIARRKRQRFK